MLPIPDSPVTREPDPRLAAFSRLMEASDRADVRAAVLAIRELRALGWSVVPTGKAGR